MKTSVFEYPKSFCAAGVSAKQTERFIEAWKKEMDTVQLHSLILLRHGKCVFRMNVAPYDDHTPHALFSLSKSFTSAAAAFAVSEGLLRWDSAVTEVLPEEIPEGREEELSRITLEALLCMGSGLDEASDSPSPDSSVTWARHVLSHPVKYAPMSHFHYNTFGTYLVSCMVQKAAGQNIRDYLMPRLFDRLGIEKPHWDLSPQNICCGGFGLYLSTEDIARFGQCLLDRGMWQGEQVLPKGWVELATREHIANYQDRPEEGNEWGQGYGFQFWRCTGGRYRGDGAMGQFCIVDEAHDAVIAATCGTNDMGKEYRLIREELIPALDGLQEGDDAQHDAVVFEKLSSLAYPVAQDDGGELQLPQGVFETEVNGMKLSVSFAAAPYKMTRIRTRAGNWEAAYFYLPKGAPALCTLTVNNDRVVPYFGQCVSKDGGLHVMIRCPAAPDACDGLFYMKGDDLVFDGTEVNFLGGHAVLKRTAQA